MVKLFGVEIDTSKMTVEELEKTRNEIQEALNIVKHEILVRKSSKHNYSS